MIVGIILLILGFFGVVLSDVSPGPIATLNDMIGDWTYWFLVIGGLMVLFLGWYLADRFKKIKEFNELIDTKSKSKFVKNIARLETLALTLGPEYEERVIEKERKYNIKR